MVKIYSNKLIILTSAAHIRPRRSKARASPSSSTSPATMPAIALMPSDPLPIATPTAQYSSIGMSTAASPNATVSCRFAPRCASSRSIAWALVMPLTPRSPNSAVAPPTAPRARFEVGETPAGVEEVLVRAEHVADLVHVVPVQLTVEDHVGERLAHGQAIDVLLALAGGMLADGVERALLEALAGEQAVVAFQIEFKAARMALTAESGRLSSSSTSVPSTSSRMILDIVVRLSSMVVAAMRPYERSRPPRVSASRSS